jgi:chromosome segregation ATPase
VKGSDEAKEAYFNLQADMQANNAESERERSRLLTYAQTTLVQKRQTAESLVNIQKRRFAQVELSAHQARTEVARVAKQLEGADSDTTRAGEAAETASEAAKRSHDTLHKIEQDLLEKEYLQREMELEKQLKAQDAKLATNLEELKRRCRGFLGQFFELVNPISKKYELASKVSLLPCLRYLVVETAADAKYTTEFLKEKGLQKHVLVLENLPVVKAEPLSQRVKELGGEALSDVIDVAAGQKLASFRKAVDFYTKGKIVCADFAQAIRLQREAGCKSIVTLDGAEFKSG